ncbi:MAG TPA: glycoside hydrolase family 2 TIM barrel-domain containing protein [Acidimicrobiales bacterium]|nr:glycoside hydrolase family 2 TIM barrel-domain containing protein [Acidimicrobiales bacterium]
MELVGPWEAVEADEDRRRDWLDDVDPGATTASQGTEAAGDTDLTDRPWQPIAVPGHWRSTPAFADSDGPLLYRTRFDHPAPEAGDRWWLRFDGAFYQGDVWLDGGYVGDTEGYFFPHGFEVTEALGARTEHLLGVELTCRPETDRSAKRNITGVFQDWDCLDRTWNPGGLWRPVHLERTGPVRIRHLRVLCREANETRATVTFRAVLDAATAGEITLRSSVGDVDHVDQRRLAAGENQVEWQIRVDEPALWWPHALGDQPLHDVEVAVTAHPDPDSDQLPDGVPVSHRLTRRIGLRQVNLRAWVLHVNGERLFVKGANQGPSRMALGEATPEELRRDVELAKEANLDLLRIHAHVTRPEVYDAADEAGMLLWQDFPLQWAYARSIRKQAQRQARELVDLLGHHPSIAIWCGHNEPFHLDNKTDTPGDIAATAGRYFAAQELPSWNKSVLDRTVKRAIDKADGTRPVIAHSGVLPHPPLLDGTDSHLYFGWYHGEERDLPTFAKVVPRMVRFVSEFGAQAVPDTADFCEPDRWPDLDWERLARHHSVQKEHFDRRVPPADHPTFASWQRATQAYQATVIRHHVETLRRLKYRPTGGFALFCFADGHPGITWSVLDHERTPKQGHQALVDACRPVIVVADRLPAEVVVGDTLALDVHVVTDLRTPMQDIEVAAHLGWDGGGQRWRFGGHIDADACVRVGTLSVEVPDVPGPLTLTLELSGYDLPAGPVSRTDTTRIVRV